MLPGEMQDNTLWYNTKMSPMLISSPATIEPCFGQKQIAHCSHPCSLLSFFVICFGASKYGGIMTIAARETSSVNKDCSNNELLARGYSIDWHS
jgi:hypothetical protein